jgi:photosystem II stability/assembly factor-like uncharacterized protein
MIKSGFIIAAVLFISSNLFSQSAWFRVSDSIPDMVVMSMQFSSANTGYASCSRNTTWPGAFLRTTNAGLNWQAVLYPDYSADDISFLDNNTGYMICWKPGTTKVLKTTNAGIDWFTKDSINMSGFKIKFYDYNTGFVVSKYNVVRKTTDGGNTWVTQTGVLWMEPAALCCLDANTWIVADGGTNLNKTTNGGTNWSVTSYPVFGGGVYEMCFVNSSLGFIGTYEGKIFKSTNAGNNWTQISTIDSVYLQHNMTFVNENTGYICGRGRYYIFRTTNGGYNWTKQAFGSNVSINYVHFLNSHTGYAGGYDGLIFKTTNGGSVFVGNISTQVPAAYSLSQNYPNPFNPSTNIKFEIPNSSDVKIAVYDLSGKEIETIVNEHLQAGTYQAVWDASKYSSGVYFYRIITPNFSDSRKMILVK